MADLTKNINVGVDASGVKTGLQDAAKSIDSFGKTMQTASGKAAAEFDRLKKEAKEVGPEAEKSVKASERAFKALSAQVNQSAIEIASAGDKIKAFELKAQLKGLSEDMYKPQIDALRRLQDEQEKLRASNINVGLSAAQMANNLRMVPAQFTDIVVSLQSGQQPMTVLLQQGGQLKDMFGGVGAAAKALGGYVLSLVNPFSLVAAGVAALAVAYNQGSKENDAFVKSIALTGNASGVTTSQLREYARQMASVSGTQSNAAASLAEFVSAGVEGGEQLKRFAQTAIDWEKATGQAVSETAKQFADLQKDPLKAVLKLNEGANFLTSSVYEQIKALNDQGRSAEASKVAMDALDGAMRERSKTIQESLGYLERGWNAIKGAAKGAWDAMLGVGRPATIGDQLAKAQSELERKLSEPLAVDNPAMRASREKGIEHLRKEIWALTEKANAELAGAVASEEGAKATQASIKWQETLDQHLSKSEKLTRALTAAREDYNTKLATVPSGDIEQQKKLAAELAKVEASIRDQYKESGKGPKSTQAFENEVAGIRARIDAEKELIARIQERGAQAQSVSEGDKLVAKLQQEVAATTDNRTKSAKELALAEAKRFAEIQNSRLELEKQAKAQDEAEKSYRKYIDGINKSADAMGDMADKQEAANAGFGKSKVAIAEMAAEQAKLAALNAKDMGPWTPEQIDALKALTDQHARYVESLKQAQYLESSRKYDDQLKASQAELELQKYGMSLLGEEEVKRNKLLAVRKSELAIEQEIAQIKKNSYSSDPIENEILKADLIAKARINSETNLQTELARIQDQYINEYVRKYGDIFRQGFADFVNNGAEGLKAFGKSLKTTILTSVADALYKAFAQRYVVQIVASISGWLGGGTGSAAVQAVSGGGGFLSNAGMFGNAIQAGFGLTSGASAASLAYANGVGLLGGDAIGALYAANGGWAGVSAGAGAAGATGGLSGMLSSIPGWGWALAVIGALFGKDIWSALFGRKLKESGVEGTFGGENGFEGNLYKYYKGGWFRSNKTTRQEMPEEMRQGFADQFFAMDKSIREMAGAVGLGGEALDGFTAKIKVNLKGLSEEEANKKLQEEFQKIAEQMGGLVLTTEEYTQAGETQLEALARLALSITTVNGVFDALGATMLDASLSSADWASSLIELMGGLDKFSQAAATYYDLYYSDDEKRALAAKTADKGMADKGLDLRTNDADAKAKYRALVDKAIADKDEELLAWLLEFADDFSNGVDAVTQSVEAATNAVAEALQKQAEELQRARDETMSTLGLSVDGLVDGFIQEINEGRGATAGTWLADQIVGGFEQAIYEQAVSTIINSMIDGMITPMLTAALTGASISEIVSQAAIDQMIASASAAVEVLNTLLNSEDFQKGMEKLKGTIAGIGNTAGRAIPAMRSYQKQMASTGWAAGSDGVIYNAAEKAAEEAFQGIFDAAKTALDGAVGREKEYWQKFVDNAQESLDKAASYFDLVTDAAKGLRDSLDDVSTMQAAAGMVFIENALNQARQGKGLSDYDKTQEAVSAATGAMVMDNFASQAELDFEKKRLAGQLDELGVFADKQKTDAERLIEQGNAEIDRLDKLLEYWQNYGQASVDATLSVADAVKELEKQASSALGQKMLGVTYDGNGSLASFDVGTNYVPSDMTARIHRGERIIPAADNRALMAALQSPSAGNAELIQAVNRLEQRLAAIEGNTAGTQEYSRRIDGNINQVTEGGNAMRTVAM